MTVSGQFLLALDRVNRPPAIVHNDGTGWSRGGTVRVPGALPRLAEIAPTGPTDVWAAGSYLRLGGQGLFPLLEHWDGASWSRIPNLPRRHQLGNLTTLAAFAPDDVWVTGDVSGDPYSTGYLEHWDGSTWRQAQLPPRLRGDFLDLEGVAPNDIWVLGSTTHLLAHWDGSAWHVVG